RGVYDPGDPPPPSKWRWLPARLRWLPAGVVTLVVLGAVAAPWLLSSGSRSDSTAGLAENNLKPAVDSVAFADSAAVPPDTAAAARPAPVERLPVSPAAPVRRPSAPRRPSSSGWPRGRCDAISRRQGRGAHRSQRAPRASCTWAPPTCFAGGGTRPRPWSGVSCCSTRAIAPSDLSFRPR